jgi:hypothetical protein
MTSINSQWYWDQRIQKAYYPIKIDDGTVRFVTVWHESEVADARDRGALVPIDEIGIDGTETTYDMIDSFRMPDDIPESD